MWYREIGGVYSNTQKFGRKVFISFDSDLIESCKRFGNDLVDNYCTMYFYKKETQSNAIMYGSFYLDFDSDNIKKAQNDLSIVIRTLKDEFGLMPEHYKIYFSGAKGFHLIIPPVLLNVLPKRNLNEDYKKLALYLNKKTIHKTIDTRIYDSVRLFRVPNTINSKTGLYKVRVSQEEAIKCDIEQLSNLALSPRDDLGVKLVQIEMASSKYAEIVNTVEEEERIVRKEPKNITNNKQELLPCILAILSQGAEKGNRNNTAIVLASCLLQAKDSLEEVMDLMIEWNESINTHPLPQSELRATVISAYNGYKGGQGFGCKSIREIGFCLAECHLNRRG